MSRCDDDDGTQLHDASITTTTMAAATECATSGRLAREQPLLSQSSTVSRDASVAGETTEQRFLVSEDDVAATHVSCADNNIFHFSPSELTDGAAHDLLYT